jgi:D-threo-aldose 1-dehydrogenase
MFRDLQIKSAPESPTPGTPTALADSALKLSTLGFGAAAIGNLYAEVGEDEAGEAIVEAYRQGIRYFDTAPFYGYGLSERRLGHALAQLPDDVVVSTKVGRLILREESFDGSADGFAVSGYRAVFDYSRSGILRSFDASLERLRRDRVDILLLHDVGRATHEDLHDVRLKQALDEALPAMAQLKATGGCRAIGIGVNEEAVCLEVMARFDLDCILLAGRYTLLEQASLDGVMAEAQRRGVGILVGGPFNSGLLANAAAPGETYNYRRVDDDTLQGARRIYEICASEKVDVGAAALQFPLAHPAVATVVAGMRSVVEVRSAVERMRARLPASLWRSFRDAGVLSLKAPTP